MNKTTLLLIRHVESTKNTTPSFSKKDGSETLTEKGKNQANELGLKLSNRITSLNSNEWAVVCSPTARCLNTGEVLLSRFEQRDLRPNGGLAPIISPYSGFTEDEVQLRAPDFMTGIKEYRKGLKSAYDIPRGSGEEILTFENRVISTIIELIKGPEELLLIIGHRSTMTAILLWAARNVYGYPSDWYGHIPIALGEISSVEMEDQEPISIQSVYGD